MPEGPGASPTPEEVREVFGRCEQWIKGHGAASVQRLLPSISREVGADTYGEAGVVAELESEVAAVLGLPAAVFMPSGTMAQQIAMRIHADRAGLPVVALHPTSHMVLWEASAHERLHGLATITLGQEFRPWSLADVEGLSEPVSVIGVELPLRELGGLLPPWEEVAGLADVVHDRGAVAHLDGARIWEAAAGYGRTPAQIAAAMDSVYVSFYKGLGAIAGAALAGDEALVAAARVWRKRHGGTMYALWPYAASALHGLRTRGPRMATYLAVARQIAAGLAEVEGLEVVPEVPQTAMMHLYLQVGESAFAAAAMDVANDSGVATWSGSSATTRPRWRAVELAVGDATVEMGAEAVVAAITHLVGRARS